MPPPFNAPAVGGHATVLKSTSGNLKETDTINKWSKLCMPVLRYYLLCYATTILTKMNENSMDNGSQTTENEVPDTF